MVIKYQEIADIPACDCCGKPHIDEGNLDQYSIKILQEVRKEVVKCKAKLEEDVARRTPLSFPGPSADEIGVRNFMESPRIELDGMVKRLKLIDDEIAMRTGGVK